MNDLKRKGNFLKRCVVETREMEKYFFGTDVTLKRCR